MVEPSPEVEGDLQQIGHFSENLLNKQDWQHVYLWMQASLHVKISD